MVLHGYGTQHRQGDVLITSNLNSYLTYVLHNVNGRVYVLKCVLWYGSGKHNAVQIYIYECYLVLFGKPEQTLGFHICTYGECICYVLCFHAWCLGFSWSVVHVKPRAYKLEQGTYHTILK